MLKYLKNEIHRASLPVCGIIF